MISDLVFIKYRDLKNILFNNILNKYNVKKY